MKVPLSWLRDYVDLPSSIADLAERLTLAGLEVASVRFLGLPVPAGLYVKVEEAGPVWERDRIVIGNQDFHRHAASLVGGRRAP